jgi:hypothetical protein
MLTGRLWRFGCLSVCIFVFLCLCLCSLFYLSLRLCLCSLLSLSLSPSLSLSLSLFFLFFLSFIKKHIFQILISLGVASNRLPKIPLFIEVVYATATAVLFHLSITEPQSLKPSYFAFMNRITGNR